MLEFRTQGFNGYSVKYSPFFDSRIAVATSANFGLVGNGRLYILGLKPDGIEGEKWFDTQDSVFDTAWSEAHENQILAGCGDGSIKLFDITLADFPVQSWQGHSREVFAVHWNLITKDTFLSSSWDGTIRIWNPQAPVSIGMLPTRSCTYSAQYSPHSPSVVSAVSSDSHLRIFDLRTPASASNHLTISIPIHAQPHAMAAAAALPSEALTHDWNKYRDGIIATAGVDRTIRTFDIRQPGSGPAAVLPGHQYAVRRLTWSPHLSDMLLSASYDMTCRVWTDGTVMGVQPVETAAKNVARVDGREIGCMDRHTEFVTGVDWCLFGGEGWCASCGWDERLLIWDVRAIIDPGSRP